MTEELLKSSPGCPLQLASVNTDGIWLSMETESAFYHLNKAQGNVYDSEGILLFELDKNATEEQLKQMIYVYEEGFFAGEESGKDKKAQEIRECLNILDSE